ncbi:hypothetical protein D3C85_1632080 [compost metagenome]
MGVEAFALERDKQVAGLDGTAVGVHARERARGITHHTGAGHPAGGLLQIGHRGLVHADTPRVPSVRRTCSRSENGRFLPWISCVASWPLPATSTTSAVAACLMA